MAKLFGIDLAKTLGSALGPQVQSITLIKSTPGTRTPGDLTSGTNPTTANHTCKGFTEFYSDYLIDGTRIQAKDKKISVFGSTISGGVEPDTGDQLVTEDGTFTILDVKSDPAKALFTCQAR